MIGTTGLADRVHDLWSDEHCAVRLSYDESAGSSWPWIVGLEWTSEHDNPHHAEQPQRHGSGRSLGRPLAAEATGRWDR